ncbi:tubulin---tyrosine ligase [Strigomonas culicis]|uniref:Tubulin--tyrosine ligase n=1 Tax=Strigomonas culicis TaxID=28005 RepID=S9W392_9TRYP|nr:tubulin---tyrosine ligase [Strigomonas culicis]|eukprot:EPY33816.1 tubulin---tyrosine ligase [Strigomonas culicis]
MTSSSTGMYYKGKSSFSVYEEMEKQLQDAGWSSMPLSRIAICDIILGDRFKIPYVQLRCEPMAPSSRLGGVRWINYFKGSNYLTMKAHMAQVLKTMDSTSSEWMPETYVLGGDQKIKADEREGMMAAATAAENATWIIKPGSGAKGKGILIVRGSQPIRELIESHPEHSKLTYAVQRYVDRPLLLTHGRKFDIRVWTLLTSPYSIYAFSQASCRTASAPYDPDQIDDTLAHLTNHCLQEGAADFGRYEDGNELWLPELQAYLEGRGEPASVLRADIVGQMANIVVRTLLAMRPEMEVGPEEAFQCFQLFGYDMLVDESYRVHLLEINGSPGVAERWLSTVVRQARQLLGCGDGGAPVATRWDIDKAELVRLWQVGDPVPAGMHASIV